MIKSPATLWRDTEMAVLRGQGAQFQQIGPAFGISGGRVSQCLEKRARLRRLSVIKLNEFKAQQCFAEMLAIKRAYDRMNDAEKASNKAAMAAQLDALIAHRQAAESAL